MAKVWPSTKYWKRQKELKRHYKAAIANLTLAIKEEDEEEIAKLHEKARKLYERLKRD